MPEFYCSVKIVSKLSAGDFGFLRAGNKANKTDCHETICSRFWDRVEIENDIRLVSVEVGKTGRRPGIGRSFTETYEFDGKRLSRIYTAENGEIVMERIRIISPR